MGAGTYTTSAPLARAALGTSVTNIKGERMAVHIFSLMEAGQRAETSYKKYYNIKNSSKDGAPCVYSRTRYSYRL